MEIREQIRSLIELIATKTSTPKWDIEDMIVVSSATRRIAHAYERFRNVLEPAEEDILRRKAIWRILDRRLQEDKQAYNIATSLLQELIRAHYITPVPKEVATKIAPYITVTQSVLPHLQGNAADEFLDIVAVTIDRLLYPRLAEESLVKLMYGDVYQRLVWTDDLLAPVDRPAQVYIASHRALFAADEAEIKYHFFINQFPFWREANMGESQIGILTRDVPSYMGVLSQLVHHPARERLLRIIRPTAVPYRILLDVINANGDKGWDDDKALQEILRTTVAKRTEHIQTRLTRRAWHAIMFLFFTKTLVALFIEVPYELFLFGQLHWLSLITNITFHPVLLFVASITVRTPGASNTDRIVEQVKKIMTPDDVLPNLVVNKPRRYGLLTWTSFALIYTALFMFIFWRLFILLDNLEFSLPAMMIFVVFLGLVSFLAMRIRRSVDDIRVLPKREGAVGLFLSFVSLPILEFGRWLTAHVSQLNLILFFMDLILEAPFKLLIDVVEEWFSFVRDRKEEIV